MSNHRSSLSAVVLIAGGIVSMSSGVLRSPEVPYGWNAVGDTTYMIGTDTGVGGGGKGFTTALIRSNAERVFGTGTLLQSIRADDYRGERVRFTGYLRARASDGDSHLWMRIDGATEVLASDYMESRPVRGNLDWTRYDIVLDVPRNAIGISFGFALVGTGQAWLDDASFEIVGKTVKTTGHLLGVNGKVTRLGRDGMYRSAPVLYENASMQPVNLDFEQRLIASR